MADQYFGTYELKDLAVQPGSNIITATSVASNNYRLSESDFSDALEFNAGACNLEMVNGSYVVTGIGGFKAPRLEIPTSYDGIPVTSIASNAFQNDQTIKSIIIPPSIRFIGSNAFEGSILEDIILTDSDYIVVFFKTPVTTEVPYVKYTYLNGTLNNGDGTIMDSVSYPDGIYSWLVPKNINTIQFYSKGDKQYKTNDFNIETTSAYGFFTATESNGSYELSAQWDYKPDDNFDLYDSLSIGTKAFYNCQFLGGETGTIKLPNRITGIAPDAFGFDLEDKIHYLVNVIFPDDHRLSSIGARAFKGCNCLTTVNLGKGVKTIGVEAFSGCVSLESIDLPEGIRTIGSSAFAGCNALEAITIPSTVTQIASYTFAGCNALEAITIPSTVTQIAPYAFDRSEDIELGHLKYVKFEDNFTWVTTLSSYVPKSGEGVRLMKPTDLFSDEFMGKDERENGDALCKDFTKYYWHKIDRMLPPHISITGETLRLVDPLGVAEEFRIYVNDKTTPKVIVDMTQQSS